MNSKIIFLSAVSVLSLTACNSNENDSVNSAAFHPLFKKIKPTLTVNIAEKEMVQPRILPLEEGQSSSDGLLKVVKGGKKNKIVMGTKTIETNFDLSANVVAFERINKGPIPEYFLLTNNTFNGDKEEVMTYSRALHCRLVDSVLQIVPMQTFADEKQMNYDTTDVYSIYSIHDFMQNEGELFGEEEDAKSFYIEYNPFEKSFIYKETFRDFVDDESTEGFYEEVGKFEYKNGAFYQVKENLRKI